MFDRNSSKLGDGAPSGTSPKLLGHVHGVKGSQVTVGLLNAALDGSSRELVTVGKFLSIETNRARLVGAITDVAILKAPTGNEYDYCAVAHVDLMGEIDVNGQSGHRFRRGVSNYPTIGDSIRPLMHDELSAIFNSTSAAVISIGSLQQASDVHVCVNVEEVLSKHFAVLGATGVGKSCGVAHILRQMMLARPDLRIFLLDAHNEYDSCFRDSALVVNPGNLRLPFWLFNFEEILDVVFWGRSATPEETEILSEVIPLARAAYTQYRAAADRSALLKKGDTKRVAYTVDTPVPYRLADLLTMIDERMGKLENRSSRLIYHKLITRIEAVSNDPRYAFMFENANVGGDTMAEVISQLFRVPANGRSMTIMQLAHFPAEVMDALVSVLTRLAFDFGMWSDGVNPLLFVLEEAHKYASADRQAGFTPTRRAIARVAMEGRKYGVYIGLVTQRPAELDPTIISQCGTLFAMRMSNDHDQALLRSAVPDNAANLLDFVPSLGTREALAFGVGIPLPTRLTFSELSQSLIPKGEAVSRNSESPSGGHNLEFVALVLERWRSTTMSRNKLRSEDSQEEAQVQAPAPEPLAPSPVALDPARFSLLKRPIAGRQDASDALQQPPSIPLHR